MSRNVTFLWVVSIVALVIAGAIAGCSSGNDSPTAPPDPIVSQPAGTSGSAGISEPDQVQGPGVHIEKATNDFDADTAPGPSVEPGQLVTWLYEITNIGDVTLVSWVVTDKTLLPEEGDWIEVCRDTDPDYGPLEPLETATCEVRARAIEGQYANLGRVQASDGDTRVEATDPSHYNGGGSDYSAIELQKTTQVSRIEGPQDADYPIGPIVLVGEPVRWDYTIENIGEVDLDDWLITDDVLGEICRGNSLAVGETNEDRDDCYATGFAQRDQYSNIGLVRAFDGTARISDEDPSHYFGSDPAIDMIKYTNGENDPILALGCEVNWTYVLTNRGNIDLEIVEVMDTPQGPATCPQTDLPMGNDLTCEISGGVVESTSPYTNSAVVTAQDPVGNPVSAEDSDGYTVISQDPVCANAQASPAELWPPNHGLVQVDIEEIGDFCDRPLTVTIDRVYQDEPVNDTGDGNTSPDADGVGTETVRVRAERQGGGDGRVYFIDFTVSSDADPTNDQCSGRVMVEVPHDQSGAPAVDSGQYYDSVTGDPYTPTP